MTEVTLVSFTEYCNRSNLMGPFVANAVFTIIIYAEVIPQMPIKTIY